MVSKKEDFSSYEIKISLLGVTPPVWRLISVPRDISLAKLHVVIQIAMGWEDEHLHQFEIGKKRYGQVGAERFSIGESPVNEDIVRLNAVAKPKAKFTYSYDFGDSWDHALQIEREIPSDPGVRVASCINGENHCPPEDCGGPYGYARMLEIIADPNNEKHADMKEWLGDGFDPKQFDLRAVSGKLASLKV